MKLLCGLFCVDQIIRYCSYIDSLIGQILSQKIERVFVTGKSARISLGPFHLQCAGVPMLALLYVYWVNYMTEHGFKYKSFRELWYKWTKVVHGLMAIL